MIRKSSQDEVPHMVTIIGEGEEKYYEVEHLPTCETERVDGGGIGGPSCYYDHFTCRLGWVIENWGFDFLEHEDGSQGWQQLEPGEYKVVSYTEYIPGEFGGTYGEEQDTGARLLP